jgi:hypothetical protein
VPAPRGSVLPSRAPSTPLSCALLEVEMGGDTFVPGYSVDLVLGPPSPRSLPVGDDTRGGRSHLSASEPPAGGRGKSSLGPDLLIHFLWPAPKKAPLRPRTLNDPEPLNADL